MSAAVESFLNDLCFWECKNGNTNSNTKAKRRKSRRCKHAVSRYSAGSPRSSKESRSHSSSNSNSHVEHPDLRWRFAVDSVTGRTYYYDIVTLETTWKKPLEIRMWEKQKKREQKERNQAFFRFMEDNIYRSLHRQELIPGIPCTPWGRLLLKYGHQLTPVSQGEEVEEESEARTSYPAKIRTISSIDEQVLLSQDQQHESILRSPISSFDKNASNLSFVDRTPITRRTSLGKGRPPLLPPKQQRQKHDEDIDNSTLPDLSNVSSSESSSSNGSDDTSIHSAPGRSTVGAHVRHSTSGENPAATLLSAAGGSTLNQHSTISNPDVASTIRTVCAIFRWHMLEHVKQQQDVTHFGCNRDQRRGDRWADYVRVFDDYEIPAPQVPTRTGDSNYDSMPPVPALQEIVTFYTEYYAQSKMEEDTIIISLVYLERLMKHTQGRLRPTPYNWRSLLFSCMILASKVWDDFSMWNVDFSKASALTGLQRFPLWRINNLEVAILVCLVFDVRVMDSEYAKYYFLIRTLVLRSNLVRRMNKKSSARQGNKGLQDQPTPMQLPISMPTPVSSEAQIDSPFPSSSNSLEMTIAGPPPLVDDGSYRNTDKTQSQSVDWGAFSAIYPSSATVTVAQAASSSSSSATTAYKYSKTLADNFSHYLGMARTKQIYLLSASPPQ